MSRNWYKIREMNVFIFHGTGASPESNWFPWLKKELESNGVDVLVPKFPTPKGQSLDKWLRVFEPFEKKVTAESIFVGHSMGRAFIWRLLEKGVGPIRAAILVSPFDALLNLPDFDPQVKSFVDHPFDWEKIRVNCQNFVVYAGGDDPYIPREQLERVVKNLKVKLNFIKGGKHLNAEAGYLEFPQILKEVWQNR